MKLYDGPVERLYFTKNDIETYIHEISKQRHISRYTMIRQWCHGNIVDCACGCGYGTFLISENPDVDHVYGIDSSDEAIQWAASNFSSEKISFINNSFFNLNIVPKPIDILISIETIEHIKDTQKYIETIKNLQIKEIMISYPTKKSTHFNKFHYHDFQPEEIYNLFKNVGYIIKNKVNLYYEVELIHFELQSLE